MTRKHADYIYRNKHDSLRVRVHRRESGRWDYDVFYTSGKIATHSDEAGDDFATKRDALTEAKEQHGPLHAIAVEGNVTDPAWYRRASERTPVHSTVSKKTPAAQLDREIATVLKPPSVCGECFIYAYQFVTKKGGVLKHGTVTHPWDKNEFPHAWIEKGGKVYDWQTAEVRKTGPLPVADFYKRWKPQDVKSYTADEARGQAARARHYGPW